MRKSLIDKLMSPIVIQFLPTLRDIEVEEVKDLARRLKGESIKETLTNILEWQDRNVIGWIDRWYVFLTFYGLLAMSYLVLMYELQVPQLVSLTFGVILVILAFLNMAYLISILVPLVLYLILLLLLVVQINPKLVASLMRVLTSLAFLLGGMTTMIVYLAMKYRSFKMREDSKDSKILFDIFRFTLPVKQILKYRLAICRDYAKLTASLLFNIYPNSEIYFINFLSLGGSHVATALKVNGKYYILDQVLPVLTMDKWLKEWNRKSANIYVARLVFDSDGKPIDIEFKKNGKVSISDYSEKPINMKKLTKEVVKMLKINQVSQKEKPDFEIPLKNYAAYYEDDEIVIYSLARAIKNKLENELCSNINKVSKVEISQNGKDLIVKVYIE